MFIVICLFFCTCGLYRYDRYDFAVISYCCLLALVEQHLLSFIECLNVDLPCRWFLMLSNYTTDENRVLCHLTFGAKADRCHCFPSSISVSSVQSVSQSLTLEYMHCKPSLCLNARLWMHACTSNHLLHNIT